MTVIGFIQAISCSHERTLAIRISRNHYGNLLTRILVIMHNQENECEHLTGMLYTNRLTQKQIGDVFQDIYDRHLSKVSIAFILRGYFAIVLTYLGTFNCILKIYHKRSMGA